MNKGTQKKENLPTIKRSPRSRKPLKGETVKEAYRAVLVKHKDGTWEVTDAHKLKTNFRNYKKTRQGKWRKMDKRRFTVDVLNTVDYYKTR
jgi:hypothetical protein